MTRLTRSSGLVVARGGRDGRPRRLARGAAGEVTALLGPNGAGKSSMVLAVGGVLPLKAGSVKLGERDWPASAPSGSAAPGSRSSPRAGGCCRS